MAVILRHCIGRILLFRDTFPQAREAIDGAVKAAMDDQTGPLPDRWSANVHRVLRKLSYSGIVYAEMDLPAFLRCRVPASWKDDLEQLDKIIEDLDVGMLAQHPASSEPTSEETSLPAIRRNSDFR